ncbi:MAG: hypothetical protein ABI468_01085 [Candidatus Nanopelagicales bacterium]
MTTVEVLAPVRLETRFVAPAGRTDGVDEWMLRLRVYPDEFSIRRVVAAPTPEELDRLEESLAAMPRLDERAAFASFAGAVGPARALALWRRCVVGGTVDRTNQEPSDHRVRVHGPAGLPDELQVWFVHVGGAQELATTLVLDPSAIGDDLDIESFAGAAELAAGTLPKTWWLSYERAKEVGLGADLDIGAAPPRLEALVVVGRSDTDAADLVDAHNATSRLAVLAPGTPSNTVEGEPTTDFGDHAESLYPLLHLDPRSQQSSRVVLEALTGRVPADAVPILGGDLDHFGPGSLAVQGFWPVLWGRALRDVTTTDVEIDLARWALRHLAVEGPRPAIRVGDQPYGLLPTSAYAAWVPDPADPLADLEDRIRRWALEWRAGAAAAAEAANTWVEGADTEQLLDVLGLHAPSRYWDVRPVADAFAVQVSHLLAGDPGPPVTDWDIATAGTWRGVPFPAFPIAAAARPGQLPGPPGDAVEDPDRLKHLLFMEPEPLYFQGDPPMGLVGHLVRESMIAARAIVGEAIVRWTTTGSVDLAVAMPLDDEATFRDHVMRGTNSAVGALAGSGEADAELVATRFREVVDALTVLADLWKPSSDAMFRATLAALDTASFRVDPWLTGLADKRLQAMTVAGAPFKLGAYGWVDSPEPWPGASALAPGPTEAGLLHAPSHDQALTAALLRDATVRHRTDGRWDLTVDSAKVRASVALAERVRLGVHPYEALGLEVEKVAGDWDVVRVLREHYPLAAGQDGRRSCDGAAALSAARTDGFAGVVGVPADLAGRLEPLDHVLDTYADLLVADGVHAVVTGHADLGNAALEAAAGLGAPPDLRAIRTPRAATTVRVAAWALLAAGSAPPLTVDADPSAVADPAFAALAVAEGATTAEGRQRLAAVLGGGDNDAPVPALVGGSYPGLPDSADDDLHAAAVADLGARLAQLRQLTQKVYDAVAALDPTAAGVDDELTAVGARWRVDLPAGADPDPVADRQATLSAALADRLAAPPPGPATKTDGAVNERRAAIRTLVGDLALPVLPVVPTALLPRFQSAPDLDRTWLEIVAAVRPRLASLEAHQLTSPWPAVLSGPADPWSPYGPVLAAYGPAVDHDGVVAVAALDAWTDSIPSRRHSTAATFGFNSPKSRAPQAVLLAVPPDPAVRLTNDDLLAVVLETRELAHARATRPTDRAGLSWATPGPLVHAAPQSSFVTGWN